MQMNEFQDKVNEILTFKDEDGIEWLEESLNIYPVMDGCMSASFRGELIPCEGVPWDEALDEIVRHLTKRAADLPPGWYDSETKTVTAANR